jgi:hypothetical protein
MDKDILTKKKTEYKIFLGVLIVTLIYWYFVYGHYSTLNLRPHGLLYVFPISFLFNIGIGEIGFGVTALNFIFSLAVNCFLILSVYYLVKKTVTQKLFAAKIFLWLDTAGIILLFLFYNYLCLAYYVVE